MKQCPYCAKEIGYHEYYCCDECQKNSNDFFDLREKRQTVFSIFNGICVLGIGINIFLYAFVPDVAIIAGSVCAMILGAMYFFLPFPAEVMIEKFKLKKALFITRIVAVVLFVIGATLLLLHLFGII